MEVTEATQLLEIIIALIEALSWPLIVVFILLYFGNPLKKFLGDLGEFSFKAGASGLEATAKKQQIMAAALLGAASASKRGPSEPSGDDSEVSEIAQVVSRAIEPRKLRSFSEAEVLWVDDRPMNNVYERRALEALGIGITLSTSTEDALEKLRSDRYDVVISDMGRPPDKQAGYSLLQQMRQLGYHQPFIIYAGSNLPEHKAEARRRGASDSTNNPQELFDLVTRAIQQGG